MATAAIYNKYKAALLDGSTKINLAGDTIRLALVQSAYTPDIDSDQYWSTPQAHEASGTGYTAGGAALTTPTVTVDTADDRGKFDADDVTWTISSALTARYAILYKDTGTASTSPLIGYVDFGTDYSLSAGTLTLTWSANGVLTIS